MLSMITDTLVYGMAAFAGTAAMILILKEPAQRFGLLDSPSGRKHHQGSIPLSGGPALVATFIVMAVSMHLLPSLDYAGLLAGLLVLAGVGVADDLFGLSVAWRFAAQMSVILTCLIFWGHLNLTSLGDLLGLGGIRLGVLAIPCAVFCVIGVINAFNMCDGMDGLAGGLASIAFSFFAGVGFAAGDDGLGYLLVLLLGGLLGFLSFNMRTPWRARASVFLGDSGSMCLGFALCWLALELSQGSDRMIAPITAVWILGLPIIDTVNVMVSRISRGRSPFRAGRDHLHHTLLNAGFTPGQAVNILLLTAAVLGGFGVLGESAGIPQAVMFFSMLSLGAGYFLTMRQLIRRGVVKLQSDAEQVS